MLIRCFSENNNVDSDGFVQIGRNELITPEKEQRF